MEVASGPISFDIVKMVPMSRHLVYPKIMLCADCQGEGVLIVAHDKPDIECGRCKGSGSDPNEGKTFPIAAALAWLNR
jgi:DnaJ-class molecular chaperone